MIKSDDNNIPETPSIGLTYGELKDSWSFYYVNYNEIRNLMIKMKNYKVKCELGVICAGYHAPCDGCYGYDGHESYHSHKTPLTKNSEVLHISFITNNCKKVTELASKLINSPGGRNNRLSPFTIQQNYKTVNTIRLYWYRKNDGFDELFRLLSKYTHLKTEKELIDHCINNEDPILNNFVDMSTIELDNLEEDCVIPPDCIKSWIRRTNNNVIIENEYKVTLSIIVDSIERNSDTVLEILDWMWL